MAVALVEPVLGAEPPDRELHKARKGGGEGRVEMPGIDIDGNQFEDIGAAAGRVTGGSIRMTGVEARAATMTYWLSPDAAGGDEKKWRVARGGG